jgi:hypothetical protein
LAAAEDDEVDLRDRDLVELDDPHRQAVGQLLLRIAGRCSAGGGPG